MMASLKRSKIVSVLFVSLALVNFVSALASLRGSSKATLKGLAPERCSCESPRVDRVLIAEATENVEQTAADNVPGMGLLQPLNFLEIRCGIICRIKNAAKNFASTIKTSIDPTSDVQSQLANAAETAVENAAQLAQNSINQDDSQLQRSTTNSNEDTEAQPADDVGYNVEKGTVSDRMIKLGKMSSYAYAHESVENKEKKWYEFWKEDHLTLDKKLVHGINHVEKLMQKPGSSFGEKEYVDRELTMREAKVFVNELDGEVVVAFKGTNFLNGDDIAANYALFDNMAIKGVALHLLPKVIGEIGSAWLEENGQREIQEVLDLIEKTQSKYQTYKVVATGHSQGGAKALYAGRHFGIEAMAFNPGPLGVKEKPCSACTIVRTESDIISIESSQYADVVLSEKDGWKPKDGNKPNAHSTYPGSTEIDRISVNPNPKEDTSERFLQKFPPPGNKLKGGTSPATKAKKTVNVQMQNRAATGKVKNRNS